jgi:GNAT superfamily N-acetyltransferase
MLAEINQENLKDVNKANEGFTVFGRVTPEYKDGCWQYNETLLDIPYDFCFPDEDLDYSEYIKNRDKIIFFYYDEGVCAGQIILEKLWNGFSFIRDLCVAKNKRSKGIGRRLMNAAVEWTKMQNLKGIMVETQDINISGCRFYHKCGFELAGIDTMTYSNMDYAGQRALFWYYRL